MDPRGHITATDCGNGGGGEIGWIMGGVDAHVKCNHTAYGFTDEMDRQQQETEEYVAKRSLSSSR